MDCAEIRQGFGTGKVPSGAAVREHLVDCAPCHELFADGAVLGRGLSRVGPDASARVAEQLVVVESLIAGERGVRAFLRSRATRTRWLSMLALAVLLLGWELVERRAPLRELGAGRLLAGLLLFGALALVAHSALRPLPLAPRAARARMVLALGAWCLPCMLWLTPETRASVEGFSSVGFGQRALGCFGYGSALALPSFALLWGFHRAEHVPYRVGALAAGLVALLSSLILLLHCPSAQRAHLFAGHFSIGLVWFAAVSTVVWWRGRAR